MPVAYFSHPRQTIFNFAQTLEPKELTKIRLPIIYLFLAKFVTYFYLLWVLQ